MKKTKKRKPREWWVVEKPEFNAGLPVLLTYKTRKEAVEFGADPKKVYKVREVMK